MTLQELKAAALAELDHPADTAALQLWEEKLTRFANEAQDDLFSLLRPWCRETAEVLRGEIDLGELDYGVSKVLGVERNGVRLPFYYGANRQVLILKGVPDGAVEVVYRYTPDPLVQPTDMPKLPSVCHPLIVLYMVARFQMHSDAQGLNHANMLLSIYEAQKRRIRMDYDKPSGYNIMNAN